MIEFGLLTFRAEINAMPCPPDEFEIVINTLDTFAMSDFLIESTVKKLMPPFVNDYDIRILKCQRRMAHVVRFTRFKREPYKCHVHDTILSRMNQR